MRRAVFLDRDGVLNRSPIRDGKPVAPDTLDDFEILPGVPEALDRLRARGFLLIVVTNQPDVARGRQRREVVDAMHALLRAKLPLDDMKICWDGDEASPCYKPHPGLLLDAAAEREIDLGASYMVGDRWRDVGAGKAAGCFTIFIDRKYREALKDTPDATCGDLAEAADLILAREARGGR